MDESKNAPTGQGKGGRLAEYLNENFPKQAEEIKRAVRDKIPVMIIDNTASGKAWGELNYLLRENGVPVLPDTVADFREYNTAYLTINLNVVNSKPISKEGEEMNESKNAPLMPYGENGFKEATAVIEKDGSLKIVQNKEVGKAIIELAAKLPYYEWAKIVHSIEKAQASASAKKPLGGADAERVKQIYEGL